MVAMLPSRSVTLALMPALSKASCSCSSSLALRELALLLVWISL